MSHRMTSVTRPQDWEHGLITGTGRQGAVVHGGPDRIRITLSHERLCLPLNAPIDPPATAAILPELRELILSGRPQAAAERVVGLDPEYRELRWIDPLVGAAELSFTPRNPTDGADFRRSTDFRTGIVTHEWDGVRVTVYASRATDAIMCRITGIPDGVIRLDPLAGEPPRPIDFQKQASTAELTLRGQFRSVFPLSIRRYATSCRIDTDGGTVRAANGEVHIFGARSLTLVVRTAVDSDVELPSFGPASVDDRFSRCSLSLGPFFEADSESLLASPGPALFERLFDAGRYAIAASTGQLPPTLQGVWSGTWEPPWSSGYTLDGNLQSAVAALFATRTPELMLPVFDLVESVLPDFRLNASRLYGCSGLLAPAHVSTHGGQNHFGSVWCLTFWTAGAAWLGRFYYDYWRYTGDRTFLAERAWPYLTEAADFYLDFLGTPPVFVPSYSPENSPAGSGSQAAVNATMDIAVVGDLMRNVLDVAAVLGIEDARESRWRDLLASLPPYRINENGELAEWAWPGLNDEHAHRHASHLYPLWYELDPAFTDPALRAAATRAIQSRLAWWRGEEADEMAFGLVQLGLAAAQLGLADAAYECLLLMARYWRPSLVSTHNKGALFNVDICGGLPAVICAMLLRSGRRRVDLLPALPDAWPSGEVRGLAARDGITVDSLLWTPASVRAVLATDGEVTVGFPPGSTLTRVEGVTAVSRDVDSARLTMSAGRPATLTFTRS